MKTFQTLSVVPHGACDMFELVADVEKYPKFVPLCKRVSVRKRVVLDDKEIVIADMTAAYKLFRETFTGRVTLNQRDCRIAVEFLDGPFSHLETRWSFYSSETGGCRVDLFIAYKFRSDSLQLLGGVISDRAFQKFADAFEERATTVYGYPPTWRRSAAPG